MRTALRGHAYGPSRYRPDSTRSGTIFRVNSREHVRACFLFLFPGMHDWFDQIVETVRGSPEEPVLAAHVAVVALHVALLAMIAGFGPNTPSVRLFHGYDRIILDSGWRSAWVTHLFDRETVEINLHGGVPRRGLKIAWTPRLLDVEGIVAEARRQAERVVGHLTAGDTGQKGKENERA